MKHVLLALSLLLPTLPVVAQTAPRQPDQYCILVAYARTKDRASLKLVVGADPAKTGQLEEVQRVDGFEYEVDALNYLATHGWEVISITPTINSGGDSGARYYLRRRKF
jgi:hypothetical protein